MTLTFAEVGNILKLIDASQCEEVILELEGARLVVRRNSAHSAIGSFTQSPDSEAVTIVAGVPTVETTDDSAGSSREVLQQSKPSANVDTGMTDIRAPMVGTFYRRPSPDEVPFVEEGTTVAVGDPLCLIEVMKLFTTIEAPAGGIVTTIAAEDGDLVEFNQLLMRIRE